MSPTDQGDILGGLATQGPVAVVLAAVGWGIVRWLLGKIRALEDRLDERDNRDRELNGRIAAWSQWTGYVMALLARLGVRVDPPPPLVEGGQWSPPDTPPTPPTPHA